MVKSPLYFTFIKSSQNNPKQNNEMNYFIKIRSIKNPIFPGNVLHHYQQEIFHNLITKELCRVVPNWLNCDPLAPRIR